METLGKSEGSWTRLPSIKSLQLSNGDGEIFNRRADPVAMAGQRREMSRYDTSGPRWSLLVHGERSGPTGWLLETSGVLSRSSLLMVLDGRNVSSMGPRPVWTHGRGGHATNWSRVLVEFSLRFSELIPS